MFDQILLNSDSYKISLKHQREFIKSDYITNNSVKSKQVLSVLSIYLEQKNRKF